MNLKSKIEALSMAPPVNFRRNPLVRIVSEDKIIKNKLLNLCGVQVVRTMAARAIYNLRPVAIPDAVVEKVDELNREGVVLLPEFLPRDRFELIQQEALALVVHNREKASFLQTWA